MERERLHMSAAIIAGGLMGPQHGATPEEVAAKAIAVARAIDTQLEEPEIDDSPAPDPEHGDPAAEEPAAATERLSSIVQA